MITNKNQTVVFLSDNDMKNNTPEIKRAMYNADIVFHRSNIVLHQSKERTLKCIKCRDFVI